MRLPTRIPLLYLISGVLILVGVVPLYFYGTQVVAINRDRLKINEQLLQNTVTKSLSDDVEHRQATLQSSLGNLSAAVLVTSGGNLTADHVNTPELRALVERFTSSSDILDYATLLNDEGKGVSAGRIAPDAFVQRELEHAFMAAREGRVYNGQALTVGSGKDQRTTMLVSSPVVSNDHFLGMINHYSDHSQEMVVADDGRADQHCCALILAGSHCERLPVVDAALSSCHEGMLEFALHKCVGSDASCRNTFPFIV